MMDEYKFKIEEDFSLEKLSNGIIDILKRNSLMTNIEVLNQDKYIITLKNGENFCSSTNTRGSCYIGLKMQLNRYAYVHLYDEDDNLIIANVKENKNE